MRDRLKALAGDERGALKGRDGVKIQIRVSLQQKTEDADPECLSESSTHADDPAPHARRPSGKAPSASVFSGAFKLDSPTLFKHKKKKIIVTVVQSVIVDMP